MSTIMARTTRMPTASDEATKFTELVYASAKATPRCHLPSSANKAAMTRLPGASDKGICETCMDSVRKTETVMPLCPPPTDTSRRRPVVHQPPTSHAATTIIRADKGDAVTVVPTPQKTKMLSHSGQQEKSKMWVGQPGPPMKKEKEKRKKSF
mmetsp:Transcript_32709/g.59934  ORF Transcript_32709/g.59934 Transcript_32709/m.59934 type:complete len:153 (+) Transcript_32709:183-641(+)